MLSGEDSPQNLGFENALLPIPTNADLEIWRRFFAPAVRCSDHPRIIPSTRQLQVF